MAMDHAKAVMAMELNPEHKNFARLMSAKQSVLASVFTATARVRDGLLRPSSDDGLDDILAGLKRADVAQDLGTVVGHVMEVGLEAGGALIGLEEPLALAEVTADDLFN
jgi:hypothetical protein